MSRISYQRWIQHSQNDMFLLLILGFGVKAKINTYKNNEPAESIYKYYAATFVWTLTQP